MTPKHRAHGEGSLRKRVTKAGAEYWEASLMIGQDAEGKRQRWYATAKTQREARELLKAAIAEHASGLLPTGPKVTLGEWLSHWLEVRRAKLRPRVHLRYTELVRLHIAPTLAHQRLDRLTPAQLERLYADRLGVLAPQTVTHIHRLLHRALEDAVRQNMIGRNVTSMVDPPRVPKREMTALDMDKARRLLHELRTDHLEGYYLLALATGLREGELLGLRWADVDWQGGTLAVQRQATRVKGVGWTVQEPKSAKSRRSVPLSRFALSALRRQRARQAEARLGAREWDDNDLVFANSVGRVMEPQNILRRSWRPLLARVGLPYMRFHDLRHSLASLLLSQGENPKVVQEILGHSQIGLTLDTYSHVMPSLKRDALERLGELLGGD